MKKRTSQCFVFGLLFGCLLYAIIGGSEVTHAVTPLPSGIVIADDKGIQASSEGTFFVDLEAVRPGDQYKKEITIRSLDLQTPTLLGLLVEMKAQQGSVDWNHFIQLTLELEGKRLYEGPLLGDGTKDWAKQPLSLGQCTYGTDKLLVATFKVSSELTNEDLLHAGELQYYWTFVGTKTEETVDDSSNDESTMLSSDGGKPFGRLPQTGEEIRSFLLNCLIGILILLLLLLGWKKAREREEEG